MPNSNAKYRSQYEAVLSASAGESVELKFPDASSANSFSINAYGYFRRRNIAVKISRSNATEEGTGAQSADNRIGETLT